MAPATAFLPYCKMAPPHRRAASLSMPTRCFSQFPLTSPGLSWAEKAREAGAGCRATAGPGGTTRRHAVAHPSLPRTLDLPQPAAPAFPPCPAPRAAAAEGGRRRAEGPAASPPCLPRAGPTPGPPDTAFGGAPRLLSSRPPPARGGGGG